MSAAKVAAITSACDWVMVPSSTSGASFSSSALYARVSSTAVESSSVVCAARATPDTPRAATTKTVIPILSVCFIAPSFWVSRIPIRSRATIGEACLKTMKGA